ncbi:hypothetical protein LPJ56_007044 [Coemansia sp. RSA 2599]|nr:hypothetical protein LPJ75_007114 [Coemansia sp. RSA 2598]KAJ1803090.1 hypothetical protein LPJ56_007044 [Coemansia sp. RSA 2599]
MGGLVAVTRANTSSWVAGMADKEDDAFAVVPLLALAVLSFDALDEPFESLRMAACLLGDAGGEVDSELEPFADLGDIDVS